jgi:hypothetical protein
MQRGFTENTSSINTGLLLTEYKNESKEKKTPVFAVTLDGQRAFDEVWKQALMRKMYFTNILYRYWDILNQLYQNATTHVNWNREISEPFELHQGLRQGGFLSSHLYKQFNNGLLDLIEAQELGANIGHIKIPAPTCADDICCITDNPVDLQTCLYIVEDYINKHRCKINVMYLGSTHQI